MEILKKFLEKELRPDYSKYYEKFTLYNKLLLDWNTKINLISRNSLSIETQVLNSIFFLTKYKLQDNAVIIDVGTGGGFPGIPLKILKSDLSLLLNDSINKKVTALKDIVKNLELDNTEAVCNRAEMLSNEEAYKSRFDIVIAKSVATLDKLYLWTKGLLKHNGEMIFIKGGDIREELNTLEKKFKGIDIGVIEYDFEDIYKIEDKKIVIIKNRL